MRQIWISAWLLAWSAIMVACQPVQAPVAAPAAPTEQAVEEEVAVEQPTPAAAAPTGAAKAALGSEARPIQVLFLPSVEVAAIISGGERLAEELARATGLKFVVSVPTSYAATVEAMCASPDDTIGFISANVYVLANQRCGAQVGGAAVRFGLAWYAAQIVVRNDSGIQTLEELAGKSWGTPSVTSTSGYLFPSAMFADKGIKVGEIVETGGHTNAMLAVFQGDVDFATAFFSPPLMPAGQPAWEFGKDDPEVWRAAGVDPVRTEAGRVYVAGGPDEGGYRILDARVSAMETAPTIFAETRILALTDKIPNDTVSFGAEFPLDLSQEIVDALATYTASPACQESPQVTICSDQFYNWTGLEPVPDSFFDSVRFLFKALGYTEEDILGGQ